MDLTLLKRRGRDEWHIAPHGKMRVPGVIYASEDLIHGMDEKVYEQVTNVAMLPGIVQASYAMPDAIGAMGFRSAGSLPSIPIWEGSSLPAAWASIYPVASVCCARDLPLRTFSR
jgi:tRNA-splicing ligase RtcB